MGPRTRHLAAVEKVALYLKLSAVAQEAKTMREKEMEKQGSTHPRHRSRLSWLASMTQWTERCTNVRFFA
jgi:hypothetical protein